MIFRSGMFAMRPRLFSSRSRVSLKGRASLDLRRISTVWLEGAFPFGWKWPFKGGAVCARAGLSSSTTLPAIANAAPTVGTA